MEATHLCPICNVVEMVFVERIPSNQHKRLRRFKCPVCDHHEMYTCGGPDDKRREEQAKDKKKISQFRKAFYHEED